jgi:hypothetical protein
MISPREAYRNASIRAAVNLTGLTVGVGTAMKLHDVSRSHPELREVGSDALNVFAHVGRMLLLVWALLAVV